MATDQQVRCFRAGEMEVRVSPDPAQMGADAADAVVRIIDEAVAARGEASLILATGNSQLPFIASLRERAGVPWNRVRIFHMDEYLGMTADHPASFRKYMREKLMDIVHPLAFYGVQGDAPDTAAELQRYTDLLRTYPADACVMGIGENGHLAFNDPPAVIWTDKTIHVVELVESCRRQQVGEGHFRTLDDVPTQALSLTIPALLAPPRVLVVVPEARKAEAVRATLQGEITPYCPASLLRTKAGATLYLEPASAALLDL